MKQGEIDKKLLSDIVFSNEKERLRLNQIAHPMIMQTLIEQMSEAKEEIVFAEVPLLLEGGFEKEFDQIIVVMRDLNARVQAVCNRDGISSKEAIARIQSQFDYDSPKNKTHLQNINALLLENKGDVSTLEITLKRLLKQLLWNFLRETKYFMQKYGRFSYAYFKEIAHIFIIN